MNKEENKKYKIKAPAARNINSSAGTGKLKMQKMKRNCRRSEWKTWGSSNPAVAGPIGDWRNAGVLKLVSTEAESKNRRSEWKTERRNRNSKTVFISVFPGFPVFFSNR